ncbi:hypothetical protein SDC9_173420 [bioreactor metagenome]|uniref:Uncharacterized protein n=1 Tax=bioreactor metagenome TaxID=1076179 RepID=A0A645GGF2_9ZZZZ
MGDAARFAGHPDLRVGVGLQVPGDFGHGIVGSILVGGPGCAGILGDPGPDLHVLKPVDIVVGLEGNAEVGHVMEHHDGLPVGAGFLHGVEGNSGTDGIDLHVRAEGLAEVAGDRFGDEVRVAGRRL